MQGRSLPGMLLFVAALLGMQGARADGPLRSTTLDHLIRVEWKKANIVPAPPVDDAQFLRRIWIDVVGTIPPPETVTAFLADKSPDKRARAVDALLDSPRYADHWTNYWDKTLMGRDVKSPVVDRVAFRQWLHTQFAQNTGWNKFVSDLISATGQNSTGGTYAKVAGLMTPADKAMEANAAATPADANAVPVNGAVNWTLKFAGNPQDLSGQASKIFLGVQIQCAQCHDHKTEKWKQEDFRRFTACFVNARPKPVDLGRTKGMIRRVDLEDISRPFFRRGKKANPNLQDYANATPSALDGTDFSETPNRRQALAAWMTDRHNPWFADAIVNRMWSHFLGRGFIEPIDDIRPSNPATMPGLLHELSEDFAGSGYDLKHLIRMICATQVYQLSAQPAKNNDTNNTLWAHFRLKALQPEEMLDALVAATNIQPVLEKIAGDRLDNLKFLMQRQFTFLFDVDEEFEQKEFEGTIPQALMLLNGKLVNGGVSPIPGTALSDTLAMSGDDATKIEALYLRTLSRRPTAAEIKYWTRYVNARTEAVVDDLSVQNAATPRAARLRLGNIPKKRKNAPGDPLARFGNRLQLREQTPKQQAYEDFFWALLNSSEFAFNH